MLTLQELYPTKEALDATFVGMDDAMREHFEQLHELLANGAPASSGPRA